MHRFTRNLRPIDTLIVFFLVCLSAAYAFTAASPADWMAFFLLNTLIVAAVRATASMRSRPRVVQVAYDFYPVVMILVVFKEVHVFIQSIGRADLDYVFIAIDRALFGLDPTVWVTQFSTPILTEVLQFSYVSYYALMLGLGFELYAKKESGRFPLAIFTILYGFFLSYVGYILFPAVGPRFTLHDFNNLNAELPGLWFSEAMRDFINAGESIPKGAQNALALAQRDAFPSGHTQMTLIVIYYATVFSTRSRYIIYLLGTLLIISTVYLRYHYVIDLAGGAALMIVTVWTAPKLFGALERFNKRS